MPDKEFKDTVIRCLPSLRVKQKTWGELLLNKQAEVKNTAIANEKKKNTLKESSAE